MFNGYGIITSLIFIQERLRLGEELLERLVDTVRQETGDPTQITSLCKQLHTALKQFSDALEQKHAIYIHIYQFFKLFLKVNSYDHRYLC